MTYTSRSFETSATMKLGSHLPAPQRGKRVKGALGSGRKGALGFGFKGALEFGLKGALAFGFEGALAFGSKGALVVCLCMCPFSAPQGTTRFLLREAMGLSAR
eukprot:2661437-Rhodomonas_salina.1